LAAFILFSLIYKHRAISPDIQVVHHLTGANKAKAINVFGLQLH